jgi:HTH-type transcriptional regulator/antitoxin HigA
MATLTKKKTSREHTLEPDAGLKRDSYMKLIRNALPIPPQTEADNVRLTTLMLEMEERAESEGLTTEETVFAELLTIVVQDFEAKHYPLPVLPPHELLQGVMEERGLAHKDLAAIVGNKGLTTEILAGRRKVSPAIAKRLSAVLKIPVESLL